MNKYFTTELQNRSINGVPYENCQVVVGEQFTTGVIEGMIQAPEEYANLSMIGLGYFPEDEHPFKVLDELPVVPTEEEVTIEDYKKATERINMLEGCVMELAELIDTLSGGADDEE